MTEALAPEQAQSFPAKGESNSILAELEKLSYQELLQLIAAYGTTIEGPEPSICWSPFANVPATTYVRAGEDGAGRLMLAIDFVYSEAPCADRVLLLERGPFDTATCCIVDKSFGNNSHLLLSAHRFASAS